MATATGVKRTGPGWMDTGSSVDTEFLDIGSVVDTVWIGFMDIVPVIGTVKEAVELVLALYEGDEEMVKEKEKAIENILKMDLMDEMETDASMTKPRAGASTACRIPVSEVKMENITECVSKGARKPPGISQAEQKKKEERERLKRVEEIKRDMLEKIRKIRPKFDEELKEQLGRSKQGEHVFNKDILKFHSNILKTFIERCMYFLPESKKWEIINLGKHTLTGDDAKAVQTDMVVNFDADEFYVNANSIMYGQCCDALREAFLEVFMKINPENVTRKQEKLVNKVIDVMNTYEIYVDQMAKKKWVDNNGGTRFEAVKKNVVIMYKIDRGSAWSTDVLWKVAPCFGMTKLNIF